MLESVLPAPTRAKVGAAILTGSPVIQISASTDGAVAKMRVAWWQGSGSQETNV